MPGNFNYLGPRATLPRRDVSNASLPRESIHDGSCRLVAVLAVFPFAHTDYLRFVSDEADAPLAILQARAAGQTPSAAQWASLLATEGYRALARRDSSFGRPYSARVYRTFLLSDTKLLMRSATSS